MKRNHYFLLFILLGFFFSVQASDTVRASDTVFIRETQIPILIERQDNVLFYIRLDAEESKFLNEVVLDFSKSTPQHDIDRKSTRLNSSHMPKSRMPSSA